MAGNPRFISKLFSQALSLALVLGVGLGTGVLASDNSFQGCMGATLGKIFQDVKVKNGPRLYIKAEDNVRDFDSIQDMKILTYNVLNFLIKKGKFMEDPTTGKVSKVLPEVAKSPVHFEEQAAMVDKLDPDILILQEVEDIKALNSFNTLLLQGKYKVILVPGNDGRGIDIGFMVKKDMPFDIEVLSHRELTTSDGGKAFSRDYPVLHFRQKDAAEDSPPIFSVIGTHFKSKRDRIGDPGSEMKRRQEVADAVKIIKGIQDQYGKNHVILTAGDHNGDLRSDGALQGIREATTDSLDVMAARLKSADAKQFEQERYTHSYFPEGGSPQYNQLDAICIAKGGADCDKLVNNSEVIPYLNDNGKPAAKPRNKNERDGFPSDHRALLLNLNFLEVLRLFKR